MTLNLIYIGDQFYQKSGSIMSPIYQVNGNEIARSDWGKVNVALREGQEVYIRHATEREMEWAYMRLRRILAEQGKI